MHDIKPRAKQKPKNQLSDLTKMVTLITLVMLAIVIIKICYNRYKNLESYNKRLESYIEEIDQRTFIENDKGKSDLKMLNKNGQVIKYKGVYVSDEILKEIEKKFGDKSETFKAILVAEATRNGEIKADVINHNCRYDKNGNLKTDGTGWSNYCKSKYHADIGTDSVDCGYMQINYKGKVCPQGIFSAEKQVELAYEKYTSGGCGGLNCWSSYKFNREKINNIMNK